MLIFEATLLNAHDIGNFLDSADSEINMIFFKYKYSYCFGHFTCAGDSVVWHLNPNGVRDNSRERDLRCALLA